MPKRRLPIVYEYGRERETRLPGVIRVSMTYNENLRTHQTSGEGDADAAIRLALPNCVHVIVRGDPKYSNSTHTEFSLTEAQLRTCLAAIEREKLRKQVEKLPGAPATSEVIPFPKPDR